MGLFQSCFFPFLSHVCIPTCVAFVWEKEFFSLCIVSNVTLPNWRALSWMLIPKDVLKIHFTDRCPISLQVRCYLCIKILAQSLLPSNGGQFYKSLSFYHAQFVNTKLNSCNRPKLKRFHVKNKSLDLNASSFCCCC
jgi:hypothetical protein